MSLEEADGPLGPPWQRPLSGALDRLVVQSEVLEGNPLDDPTRRPLYVYRSPGAVAGTAPVPSVYVIQGYSGQVDMWLARSAFSPTFVERLDAMFAVGDCPDAIVVLVDAWTSLGGSQFLNSAGTGRYLDHLCDEIVPFVDERYRTLAGREHRGIAGKSSGGYGAMVVPMLRPDVFSALASHAGDALFECCYQRDFPVIARRLRDDFEGSYDELWRRLDAEPGFDWGRYGDAISMYAYACAYSPDPERPGKPLLPFEVATGRLKPEIWERWLELDPVRMAEPHADALRSMRRIYLDAGKQDEFFLDLGAQAFSRELTRLGIEHTLELFEGHHGGIAHRYPGAIRELVLALGER
ncbi:MAG: alpha/beta hydrolase-fold protein [Solirubrobacteraceae bacterium]